MCDEKNYTKGSDYGGKVLAGGGRRQGNVSMR